MTFLPRTVFNVLGSGWGAACSHVELKGRHSKVVCRAKQLWVVGVESTPSVTLGLGGPVKIFG